MILKCIHPVSPAVDILTGVHCRKPVSHAVSLPRMFSVVRQSGGFSVHVYIVDRYAMGFCLHPLHHTRNNLSVNIFNILRPYFNGAIHRKADMLISPQPKQTGARVPGSVL